VNYSKEYISIYLERLNPEKDLSVHIPLNQVFYIRNYYDDNCFYYRSNLFIYIYIYYTYHIQFIKNINIYNIYYINYKYIALPVEFYSYDYNTFGLTQFIKKTELNNKNSYTNKALLENNKCVFGVYFHKYNFNFGKWHKIIIII